MYISIIFISLSIICDDDVSQPRNPSISRVHLPFRCLGGAAWDAQRCDSPVFGCSVRWCLGILRGIYQIYQNEWDLLELEGFTVHFFGD